MSFFVVEIDGQPVAAIGTECQIEAMKVMLSDHFKANVYSRLPDDIRRTSTNPPFIRKPNRDEIEAIYKIVAASMITTDPIIEDDAILFF